MEQVRRDILSPVFKYTLLLCSFSLKSGRFVRVKGAQSQRMATKKRCHRRGQDFDAASQTPIGFAAKLGFFDRRQPPFGGKNALFSWENREIRQVIDVRQALLVCAALFGSQTRRELGFFANDFQGVQKQSSGQRCNRNQLRDRCEYLV